MSDQYHEDVSRIMVEGDVIRQEGDLRWLPSELARVLAKPVGELPNEAYDEWFAQAVARLGSGAAVNRFEPRPPARRPPTDVERAEVVRYGAEIAGRMSMMLRAIDELKQRVADLCEVSHALYLGNTGRRSAGDVHAAILAWGRANDVCAGWSCAECGIRHAPGTDGAIAARKLGAARCVPCGGGKI